MLAATLLSVGPALIVVGVAGLVVRRGPRALWWWSLVFGVVSIGTSVLQVLYWAATIQE